MLWHCRLILDILVIIYLNRAFDLTHPSDQTWISGVCLCGWGRGEGGNSDYFSSYCTTAPNACSRKCQCTKRTQKLINKKPMQLGVFLRQETGYEQRDKRIYTYQPMRINDLREINMGVNPQITKDSGSRQDFTFQQQQTKWPLEIDHF